MRTCEACGTEQSPDNPVGITLCRDCQAKAERTERVYGAVWDAMDHHRRDRNQQDVWLPRIRCVCGRVLGSSEYRPHLADEITKAVMSV